MTPSHDFPEAADISRAVRMIHGIRPAAAATRPASTARPTSPSGATTTSPTSSTASSTRHAMDPRAPSSSIRRTASPEPPRMPGSRRSTSASSTRGCCRSGSPTARARPSTAWPSTFPTTGRRRSRGPARHRHHVDVQARPQLPHGRRVAGGADLAQPRDPRGRRLLAAGVRRPARVGRRHGPAHPAHEDAGERRHLQDPQPRDRPVARAPSSPSRTPTTGPTPSASPGRSRRCSSPTGLVATHARSLRVNDDLTTLKVGYNSFRRAAASLMFRKDVVHRARWAGSTRPARPPTPSSATASAPCSARTPTSTSPRSWCMTQLTEGSLSRDGVRLRLAPRRTRRVTVRRTSTGIARSPPDERRPRLEPGAPRQYPAPERFLTGRDAPPAVPRRHVGLRLARPARSLRRRQRPGRSRRPLRPVGDGRAGCGRTALRPRP